MEVFDGVCFAFYVEFFLSMLYVLAGEAKGFAVLIHPNKRDKAWGGCGVFLFSF